MITYTFCMQNFELFTGRFVRNDQQVGINGVINYKK